MPYVSVRCPHYIDAVPGTTVRDSHRFKGTVSPKYLHASLTSAPSKATVVQCSEVRRYTMNPELSESCKPHSSICKAKTKAMHDSGRMRIVSINIVGNFGKDHHASGRGVFPQIHDQRQTATSKLCVELTSM